jgi:hypothetical protein
MISILMPFRADGEQRQRIFDYVYPLWVSTGFEICVGTDSGEGPFNISMALNDARTRATGDVLIVMGADHIPTPKHIKNIASKMKHWHPLYKRRRILTPAASEAILKGADPYGDWPVLQTTQASGPMAIAADVWDEIGGYDERFILWGGDDTSMRVALRTIYGNRTAAGIVTDLWHSDDNRLNHPGWEANKRLADEYRKHKTPNAMRKYLANR